MDPSDEVPDRKEPRPPLGQRFFDNMYLLLALGLLVMFTIFTAWGTWEIVAMPKGTLP
jgi:FtsH-binding integral membrane protein